MFYTPLCDCLLCPLGFLTCATGRGATEDFFIAHWNVENLFDTVDDPNVKGDEEFTPDGPKHWTDQHLDDKLSNLGKIICKMNDNRGPDVLGLCEVENRKVVEMLVAKLRSLGRDYQIVHKDSPSERGIDCALVYDAKVFKLTDSKFHHVDAGNTRDILEAKLENGGKPLYVFVDHWPAQTHDGVATERGAAECCENASMKSWLPIPSRRGGDR